MSRRSFIKATGLSAAMLMASRTPAMAGPFAPDDFDQIIPADKKLSKQWLAGLYERGAPLTAKTGEMDFIGMPINGLGTGQVYLSGDGRLWGWNLTAKKDKKNNPKGARYMQPDKVGASAQQGFALQVGGKIRTLDSDGFGEVTFTNQYPMALVDYADEDCPLKVQLEAYTPFIPLNRDESSYPVIVMRYTLTNPTSADQDVAIGGWVPNASNHAKGKGKAKLKQVSEYHASDEISTVECSGGGENTNAIALGVLGSVSPEFVNLDKSKPGTAGVFDQAKADSGSRVAGKAYASLGRRLTLAPGESKTVSFAVSWRFPTVRYGSGFGSKTAPGQNHYATQFASAAAASDVVATNEAKLYGATKRWVDTWYDSTLPYWFLERSFISMNTMQTQVVQRVIPEGGTQDIYNMEEGVRCCPGNCTHVWNYAQGLARIFPVIERECRDRIEYGLGFDESNGEISFRYNVPGKRDRNDALDGTCGTIIRVLRESQMTTDYTFLQSMWGRVKLSMDGVIKHWDPDEDGILSGAQHNTLDEPWHGQVPWLINVYHGALKASAVMARQMKQPEAAQRYEAIVAKGVPVMVDRLWNEDFGYFIHIPPDDETRMHGATNGCHIDQVLGDSWMHEVGIDPILPTDKIKQSLQSLWKYNFTPDVGAFRKAVKNGRWYAAQGDAGLVMCSFPYGKIEPKSGGKNYAGYLNECMTGFEWQVAAHMIREGMLEEGLAIGKAIYDRYSPDARNPYNEVECSDHYSRAMASYGAYLAMCGYRYDGPEGKLAFGPKMQHDDFRAAFTTAEGWGRFVQNVKEGKQANALELHYGKLHLKELSLEAAPGTQAGEAVVTLDGKAIDVRVHKDGANTTITFPQGVGITVGQTLEVQGA